MPGKKPLLHHEISEDVIGCAMTVLNRLGCDLPEKIYERALIIELRKRNCILDQQREFPVLYGIEIGLLKPDLVVGDKVIVDTKVVSGFASEHIAQMLGYLSITGLQLAILVNFQHPRLQWKRVVWQKPSA
jgi:GxxExxY protein